MSKRLSTALCLAALLLSAATPMAVADDVPATGTTGATTIMPTADETATDTAPLSLTPEEIAALQGQPTSDSSDDKSFFDKVSDFVTDNAPFIIIGIVVVAAILAGIFIMRGRNRTPKPSKASKMAAGAPAAVPSASEIRRRKRAAMQRSREEERLRRKAGLEGRQASQTSTLPLSANLPVDPIEAEKQSARDQVQAAAAVARSGAVPAPPTPTQTAPAFGVAQPGFYEPDTTFASGTPTAAELSAAAAAAAPAVPAAPAVSAEAPAVPVPAPSPEAPAAEPIAPVEGSQDDPPTQVYDVPSDIPEEDHEPAIEAPGLDAKVGEAAAAFAAGAAGGGLAARARSAAQGEPVEEDAGPDADPVESDPADDAARDAELRLRAKVAEIKAEQGRSLSAAPVPVPEATIPESDPEVDEPEPSTTIGEQLDEAEGLQRAIDSAEPIPPTPSGLAAVEQRLQQSSDERDRTLRNAESRLRRIEQRAEDAERRAAFAERLAQLKIEESDRERRLNEVISGIDRAEERAIEAEERAKAAEAAAASALEDTAPSPARQAPASEPPAPAPTPAPVSAPVTPAPPAPPVPPIPAADPELTDETPAIPVSRSPLFGSGLSGSRSSSESLNLNSATFEELRDADLSVTQATRILAYRERFGGYRSVEDLEKVPGFPAELIESLRGKITV